jgi:hypothetical protein
MLEVAHVLALDLIGSSCGCEALGRFGFGGGFRLVFRAIVYDDLQPFF